jgi:hypothetical protein
MTTPDTKVWATITRAWRKNEITIAAIAEKTGVSVDDIKARAQAEDWKPRSYTRKKSARQAAASPKSTASSKPKISAEPPPPAAVSLPDASTLPTKPPNSLTARRALIRRMYSAIDTKLQLLEKHMQSDLARLDTGTDSSAADHERDTRAIGTLIKNLGTIADIDHANRRSKSADGLSDAKRAGPIGGQSTSGSTAPAAQGHATDIAALADEADRYRRELAARLRRVVDAHTEPPAVGP